MTLQSAGTRPCDPATFIEKGLVNLVIRRIGIRTVRFISRNATCIVERDRGRRRSGCKRNRIPGPAPESDMERLKRIALYCLPLSSRNVRLDFFTTEAQTNPY